MLATLHEQRSRQARGLPGWASQNRSNDTFICSPEERYGRGVGAENQPEHASGGAKGKAGGGGVLVATRQVLVLCTIDVLS